jgi:hypothetical protein
MQADAGLEDFYAGTKKNLAYKENRRIRRCSITSNWVVHPLRLDRSTPFAPAPHNIGGR